MRISGIRLTNFGRYRGEHELELGGGVYAIVARSVSDPTRSNWAGKSSFLSAIRWALYGGLGDAWKTLDSIISTGEDDVGVDVELTDGTFISRTKCRGKSSQLRVIVRDSSGNERELAQGCAQTELDERLGMGLADFDNTVWIGQKVMPRLVRADPAERTRVITDWLDLGQLERAAEIVSAKLRVAEHELVGLKAEYQSVLSRCQGYRDELVDAAASTEDVVLQYRRKTDENRVSHVAASAWDAAAKLLYVANLADVRVADLESEQPIPIDAVLLDRLKAVCNEATVFAKDATSEGLRLTRLQAGDFDGVCPVTRSRCPVSADVVAAKAAIATALSEALGCERVANAAVVAARDARDDAMSHHRAWCKWSDELKRAISTADALRDRCPTAPIGDRPIVGVDPDLEGAVRTAAAASAKLASYDEASERSEFLAGSIGECESQVRVFQAAVRILGKSGAQRKIATTALAMIEKLANGILSRGDVAVRVSFEYGRLMQDIAAVCSCGTAFPKSAAIKICEKCGSARGRKIDDKLYVTLSETSGAAEDLAGIAIQLAAAAWRRMVKGAQWSVIAMDEPMSACDAHHRSAMAQSLAMLATDGFAQAFVVSHSDDILDALPNRLVVTADGQWSKIEVG